MAEMERVFHLRECWKKLEIRAKTDLGLPNAMSLYHAARNRKRLKKLIRKKLNKPDPPGGPSVGFYKKRLFGIAFEDLNVALAYVDNLAALIWKGKEAGNTLAHPTPDVAPILVVRESLKENKLLDAAYFKAHVENDYDHIKIDWDNI